LITEIDTQSSIKQTTLIKRTISKVVEIMNLRIVVPPNALLGIKKNLGVSSGGNFSQQASLLQGSNDTSRGRARLFTVYSNRHNDFAS